MSVVVAQSALRTSLLRYGRSWGLWALLVIALLGARGMIPRGDGGGMLIAIGQRLPEMTAAFLGVSLGIVVSTLMLPVGWIYLRANVTRRQPWQVEEVTAASRVAVALGRWAADAAVLLAMLLCLTVAGWILAFVVPLVGSRALGELTLALWLVAAPALLGLAALRILFDAVPATRGGWGDFGFFVAWLAMLIAPVASQGRSPGLAANMWDFAGFVRPLQYGAPGGATDFAIGTVDVLPGAVALDVVAGLLSPGYALSRLAWVVIAIGIAALAGVVYRPHRATGRVVVPGRVRRWLDGGAPPAVIAGSGAAGPARAAWPGLVVAEFRLIGAGRLFKLLALGVAVLGVTQDWRHVASPAALLLLIFAMTAQAGRSEARGLAGLLRTLGQSGWARRAAFVVAGVGWAVVLAVPALVHGADLGLAAVTGLVVAVVASALAMLSGSAFAARVVLLVVWYGYISAN